MKTFTTTVSRDQTPHNYKITLAITSHSLSRRPGFATLPQQGDSWDCNSLWGLLDPANGNQQNLTSICPNQGKQSEPQISMPGLEETQRVSIKEATILQVLVIVSKFIINAK